ncbi:hypothetical protein DRO61_12565 [Candidatus Bathyarchaeota archaeon]|nr:MAG: hypothetical protein DRO61_12565 [Candidatus Bathyarchaeota archaeon]
MSKYYIDDGAEKVIVTAKNAHMACVLALISGKFGSFMVNGTYRVSERGHDLHDDDLEISSEVINEVISKRLKIDIDSFIRNYNEEENKDKKDKENE